jgi:hypothetical protein
MEWNKPWYPFPTRADFEFAEFVTQSRLSTPDINHLLDRMRGFWATGCKIKARNADEIHQWMKEAAGISAEVPIPLFKCLVCLMFLV